MMRHFNILFPFMAIYVKIIFMKKELYEWQELCLKRWLANNGRGIVQAVTGSGKTYFALTAAHYLEQNSDRKLHVKIVVPSSALMHQWKQALLEYHAHPEIGLWGGGHKSPTECRYMIYVINSARYKLARQILEELKQGDSVLLIADECHHYASGQNQLIFEFLPHMKGYEKQFFSLGLSATLPGGQSGQYLKSVLGKKVYTYGITEASFQHTISPYDIYHIALSLQAEEHEEYQDLSEQMNFLYRKLLQACPSLKNLMQADLFEALRSLSGGPNLQIAKTASTYMSLSYKRKSLVALASARIYCAFDLIQKLDQKEKIIIFSERIGQAEELYQLLQEWEPERIGRYHSKMGELANKNVLERFRAGTVRILITCKAIDEGIDVPDASVGIILSGTATKRQRTQRLGRIIRKKDNRITASLYYLHIEDTSEDSSYLPDEKGHRLFELSYHFESRTFIHPAYDKRADAYFNAACSLGIGEDQRKEIMRCLQLGRVRSDWKGDLRDIKEKIKEAKYASDRNYWICMKKLL